MNPALCFHYFLSCFCAVLAPPAFRNDASCSADAADDTRAQAQDAADASDGGYELAAVAVAAELLGSVPAAEVPDAKPRFARVRRPLPHRKERSGGGNAA
eukprot:CAMPEP_0170138262 /NCGR_PEP_ID=MMETSP0033_2-20121228/4793_1 /TAXON_ID=195969 /ORGANISM="Dolichomastix tenuilepis, Strain CCMP3274" /LENGTH=99 /DNA_ID=CAMNT_0010374249 /DNA_START=37 /DNA_END=333 /DNA_ORIENTATION=-